MADLIVGVVIAVILASAVWYVYKKKKKGVKCIGCPYSENCNKKNCNS